MEIMCEGQPIVIEVLEGEDTFDLFKPIEDLDLDNTQKIESIDGDNHE